MLVGIYSSSPQSGKSTVCQAFVEKGFRHESFGQPVKESLAVVLRHLNVSEYERYLYGDWKSKVISELGVTGGYLMSHYATDFFRDSISDDVWLNCLLNKTTPSTDNVVIDDLRFPNEFRIFDVTIKIVRENVEGHDRSPRSEGLLGNYNFTYAIYNSGTLDDLRSLSNLIVEDILEKERNKL